MFIILLAGLYSCDDCTDTTLNVTELETEYEACTYAHNDLSENYMIISNTSDYNEYVDSDCQEEIDFSSYDLIIGKKGLSNGLSSIDYKLVEDCETKNQVLTVTFNLDMTHVAPNVNYNALIPKLNENQELEVEIVIN